MERRSPTGIARERETRPNNAAPRQSPGCERTHRHPRRITGTWSAGQFSRWGPPTGIARERETRPNNAAPHQSPGCERRIAIRAESRGHGALASSPGGGLRPASRGSAKPAPMTVRRTDVSGAPPAQSGLRCSLRFAQRCRPEVGVPLPARHGARGGTRRDASPGGSLRAPKVKGGGAPPFHTAPPPDHAGSERSSLPLFLRARQYATTPKWSAGLRPASRGSAKPAPTTLPPTNLTAANGASPIRAESRGQWSAGQFSRWGPPTGIARERETRPNNAAPRQSPGCERRIAIQCLEGKTMQFPKPPPEFSVSSGLPVVRWGACESSAG